MHETFYASLDLIVEVFQQGQHLVELTLENRQKDRFEQRTRKTIKGEKINASTSSSAVTTHKDLEMD